MQKENARKKEIQGAIEKIVIDAGVGHLSQAPNFEEKTLVQVMRDLAALSGQKPEVRRAKKSIAGFKVREGQVVGVKVTLRRAKMVDFFERLITIIWPRVRDFNGLDLKNIDAKGVLNTGIREQFVFPEIAPEESPVSFSMGIAIVPRKRDRALAIELFRKLGVPLTKALNPKS